MTADSRFRFYTELNGELMQHCDVIGAVLVVVVVLLIV